MELTYDVDVDIIVKKPTKISSTGIDSINEVTLEGKTDSEGKGVYGVIIKLYITTKDEREARELAEIYLQHMKKVFYFEEYKKVNWWNLTWIKEESEDATHYRHTDVLAMLEVAKVIAEYESLDHLKLNLGNGSKYNNAYIDLYMGVSEVDGEVGRYVMLYSILSALLGNQQKVDDYIKVLEPNVETLETALPGKTFHETIYTFLRNQIGHTEKTTDTANLNNLIKKNLKRLSIVVKRVVFEKG